MNNVKKAILCIIDGWGIAPPSPGNAITSANPQTYHHLIQNYPYTQLEASGIAVGLPEDMDGNSETGHLNIGAGRMVYQDLSRINMSIADGSFFKKSALLNTLEHVKKNNSTLHLIGLIGSSGVHAHNQHLFSLIMLASRHLLHKVNLHLITDGRDSPPKEALEHISQVEQQLTHFKTGQIVSILGRYYAMDRDMRLERTHLASDCLIKTPTVQHQTAQEAIKASYQAGITDEFIQPCGIGQNQEQTRLKKGDGLIFYNFRIDRTRQLTKTLIDHDIEDLHFATMTEYHRNFGLPIVFETIKIRNTLSEIISQNNRNQLKIAESEKERMITYYLSGQNENPFPNETRIIVPSANVATYDLKPEMSTSQIISRLKNELAKQTYGFVALNLAGPDMVGHTSKMEPTIKAVQTTDAALKQLVQMADQTDSYLFITADHGNAEELINLKTSDVDTEHSNFPVPLIIYHKKDNRFKLGRGVLSDVAPTLLLLLNISKPEAMTGRNLIIRDQEDKANQETNIKNQPNS